MTIFSTILSNPFGSHSANASSSHPPIPSKRSKPIPTTPPREIQCQAKLNAAISALQEIQAEKQMLKDEIAAGDRELAALAKKSEKLDKKGVELQVELAAAQALKTSAQGKIVEAQAMRASGQAKIASGEAKIASGEAKIASGEAKIASGDAKIAEAQAMRAKAEEDLKRAQAKRDQFGNQVEIMTSHIDKRIKIIEAQPITDEKAKLLVELNILHKKGIELKECCRAEFLITLGPKLQAFQKELKEAFGRADAMK